MAKPHVPIQAGQQISFFGPMPRFGSKTDIPLLPASVDGFLYSKLLARVEKLELKLRS